MSRKVLQGLGLALFAAVFVVSASAQEKSATAWRIDPNNSDSRLSVGTTDNSEFMVGAAQVRGGIRIDPGNLTISSVVFDVYPADATVTSDTGRITVDTMLSFASRSVEKKADGRLEVTGDLTFTRVEHIQVLDANEGYSGPVNSMAIVHTEVRPVTFAFEGSGADLPSANGTHDLVGHTTVSTEDFPGLREALLETNWLPVALDEDCQAPSEANEGYQAPACTGTAVAPPSLRGVPSTVGEDYPGTNTVHAPDGDKIFISLDLHLVKGTQAQQPAD